MLYAVIICSLLFVDYYPLKLMIILLACYDVWSGRTLALSTRQHALSGAFTGVF